MFSAAPVTGRKANSRLSCSRDGRNGIFLTSGWALWLADDLGASCVSNTAARRSFLANAGLETRSKPLVCASQQALLVASAVFRLEQPRAGPLNPQLLRSVPKLCSANFRRRL
jgi:hypothetical protein